MPTLIITNDFPPRIGGIESFVRDVCRLLDEDVVVLTSSNPGGRRAGSGEPQQSDQDHDREVAFPVVRLGPVLLPTTRTAQVATRLVREHHAERVLFGAAAPLALLARRVRAAGADRVIALSHGHEVWWASLPGPRALLRRMVSDLDALGVISGFTGARIGAALPPALQYRLVRIPPPVDARLFRPPARRVPAGRPRCLAAGRMIRQKGFDTLLDAWPAVRRSVGADPELVLVGDGPELTGLRRRAARNGVSASVRFAGPVTRPELAAELRSAHVFALPVRTRRLGLNAEGLGLVFLEAAASGLPVVVGDSGGAPETVLDGQSGFLVPPEDPGRLADRVARLLGDDDLAARFGAAGRSHALTTSGSERVGATLRRVLGVPAPARPVDAEPG